MGVGQASEWDKEYTRMKITEKQMRVDRIRARRYQDEDGGWYRTEHAWEHLLYVVVVRILLIGDCVRSLFVLSASNQRFTACGCILGSYCTCSNSLTHKLWPCLALWNNRRIWRRVHNWNSVVAEIVGFLVNGVISYGEGSICGLVHVCYCGIHSVPFVESILLFTYR